MLSPDTLAALRKAHMNSALHVLMEIVNDAQGIAFYLADNKDNVISNGKTYLAYPFELRWPSAGDSDKPEVRIRVDGEDNLIRAALLTLPTKERSTKVNLFIVNSTSLNTIEREADTTLFSIVILAEQFELTCGYQATIHDQLLPYSFDPTHNGGMFSGGTMR